MFLNRNGRMPRTHATSSRNGRAIASLLKIRPQQWPDATRASVADAIILTADDHVFDDTALEALHGILADRSRALADIIVEVPSPWLEEPDRAIAGLRKLGTCLPDALAFFSITPRRTAQMLDVALSVAEAEAGLPLARTRLIAAFGTGDPQGSVGSSPRLSDLMFDGSRLAAELGTTPAEDERRSPDTISSYQRARVRLAAAAAGVGAIDWLPPHFDNEQALLACDRAIEDGFTAIATDERSRQVLINGILREKF